MRKLTLIGWGVLMLAMATFWNLPAQEVIAHIRGTVTDPSGAGVPGAEVKATNLQTQVSTTVTTADDGTYEFLSLAPGNYDVTVTKAGFRSYTAHNITLTINQIYSLPVALEVGEITQSVQVEAAPTQVETTSTQLGTVVDSKQIVDLPLLGRNWTQLQQLAPGVTGASDRFGTGMGGNYASNGSESQQNSFLINGADSMDLGLNAPLIVPSPDAIDQFNFIDSTLNPEYGRNSGGVLNAIIKSGTNQFHGDAFEFYRDTFMNARDFFQVTPPVFHQNQYGGTFGGPIWKDHTFFFLSYQGTRNRAPDNNEISNTMPVFTQAQRGGLFPDVASSGNSSPIPLQGENGATYPAGTPYSTLFPNGQIPTADFNPLAVQLMNKYIPLPNFGSNQFSFNPVQISDNEQGLARIDHTFGNKDSLWATFFFEDDSALHSLSFEPQGISLPGFGESDTEREKQFTVQETHTFNPTTLNEFRVSYLRNIYPSVIPTNPGAPSSFGFSGINPQYGGSDTSMPFISLTGYFNMGFSPYGPQTRRENTYQLDDNFSKVVGSHTLKFGFDGRRYEVDQLYAAFNNGDYSFGGVGPYSTGDPAADFLLGIPDSFSQQSGGVQTFRSYEYYMYAQDSWKATNKLTLNYGLGWQVDTPLVEHRFGGEDINCFLPGQQSTIFPSAPTGLDFPGDPGCSSSGYHQHWDNVGPRFGFAYSPFKDNKTSIRGGFGIYFNRTEEELALQELSAAPFSAISGGASAVGGQPGLINPFQNILNGQVVPSIFPYTPPRPGSAVNFGALEPLEFNAINPDFTDPYSMNFNLNVQHELPGAMVLQVGYVGSLGRHLELTTEGNPISPAGTAACAANPTCVGDSVIQNVAFPSHSLYAPGNEIASVGLQDAVGVSNYNSLQVQLQKRLTHGLMFQAAYTWSHAIGDTAGYEGSGAAPGGFIRIDDPYNFALDRGDLNFDARHRFVVNYNYQLPIPKFNNPLKYVLNDWVVAGITTVQTGFPVIVGDSNILSLQCPGLAYIYYGCWDTPNVVGYPGIYNPRNATLAFGSNPPQPNYYFNPNAFAQETPGVLGDEGRGNFHGPGINETDLSLFKNIRFTESRYVQLRLEAFNVFNHTNFEFFNSVAAWEDINSPTTFGRVTTALSDGNPTGRVLQLAAKIYF
jgi:hypothetical protein